jgi:hypothetical protein
VVGNRARWPANVDGRRQKAAEASTYPSEGGENTEDKQAQLGQRASVLVPTQRRKEYSA